MPLSVGEYPGQRTDVDAPQIFPAALRPATAPTCPFMGRKCSKINRKNPQQPICTVRTTHNKPWIVCTDRLIPARANTSTPYHIATLGAVAEVLFPGVYPGEVGYRNQVTVSVGTLKKKRVVLDYVLDARECFTTGRNKVILEVQGGGETSSTGTITRHVSSWASSSRPTNAFLRQGLPGPGIIPNNAWKRQLEQVTRKFPIAERFGGAFALVVGEVLFDDIQHLFPDDYTYFPEWEIALISIGESSSRAPGAITFDRVISSLFLTFAEFIAAIQAFPLPADLPDPFDGLFRTLSGREYVVQHGEVSHYSSFDGS